ncbi:Putative Heme-regulated two-component response regulator [plant metagenome]
MKHSTEVMALDWEHTHSRYSAEQCQLAQDVSARHTAALADDFYDCMLADQGAAFFLSHELVQTRLRHAMQEWLLTVFDARHLAQFQAAVAYQYRIGEVHARIEIPVHFIIRGMRLLTRRMHELLHAEPDALPDAVLGACRYISEVTLISVEIMCHAYETSHDRKSRAEEGYRLLALSQNIGAEKERQRAALLDWENQLMFGLSADLPWQQLPRIRKSEFGLWFTHKASHAFEGASETRSILLQLAQVDSLIQTASHHPPGSAQRAQALQGIRDATQAVAYLVECLFEQAGNLESGRDTLTRLLNRKYLQVVMNKEIAYARKIGAPLSVLLADIDHFKLINDTHGHDGGDVVLQQVASLISTYSRGGDYTFRLGGEEFLIVLVDVDGPQALSVADALRRRVQERPVALPDGSRVQVTLSVGVSGHSGHPDYQRLLKSADQALYAAKAAGRNRCVLAEDDTDMPSGAPASHAAGHQPVRAGAR